MATKHQLPRVLCDRRLCPATRVTRADSPWLRISQARGSSREAHEEGEETHQGERKEVAKMNLLEALARRRGSGGELVGWVGEVEVMEGEIKLDGGVESEFLI